ncbi:MAG TPA: carboxypeptidase regulatory-like domain-containing protein [Vicinamibacterales bacterium]|nr:carboxypeptidase regulatory-like domain-containing protein [Vicinamibacterales bacterium]
MIRAFAVFGLALTLSSPAFAQSQAINGTIEGTVLDDQGAVLPGVTITITNIDTGDTRVVVSNESGLYRAPLLPLGTYRVAAELQGFKRFEQTGITVSAGRTAVIDVKLSVGAVAETITVTADAPLVDSGRIELGRTLTEAEIKTLPLTSRNPYNFALLQPGVVGFENQEFGVPRITANGALLRLNYQIDGSNNTQKDRAGLRQMPMSEVMIREVKVVTTGYAPEFGQTMGLIYNAITPSGTNTWKGQGSYRLQRRSFAAFPFFTQGPHDSARKPPTDVNILTGDLGGPIVRDRTHFFVGYEHTERDLSGGRVITITPANQAALGLSEPLYMPAALNTEFAIGKVEHQLSANNRLSMRYIFFDNFIPDNTGNTTSGVPNSVQQGTDFSDRQHSTAAQLISTIRPTVLNELRVQYATRAQGRVPGSRAGTGPAIRISGVANFGSPIAGDADAGFAFTQDVFQVNDNLTYIRADHAYKFGIDAQNVADTRTRTATQLYTFPNVAAYLAARSGANPFGYSSFIQYFGNTDLDFSSQLYGFFVQDDWRIASTVKLLYGIRYDIYDVPPADPSAPFEYSRDFLIDKNNWAPRVGIAWTIGDDRRTVVRANTGVMYDQALLAMYEQSLINDGTPRRANSTFQPATPGAPAFPNVLSAGAGAQPNTLTTVDPAFKVAHNWQNNVQVERQLNDRLAVAVGTSYSKGNSLPVITNINAINPIGTLPDGRPIFSTAINSTTRLDPRYNVINVVQSVGDSTYKNLTLQFTGRNFRGVQFDLAYTLGKSSDNAPITSTLSVQGDAGRVDPTDLERDRGPNILDQRHTFTGSIVANPHYGGTNRAMAGLINGTVLGAAMLFASGIPVNVRSNQELNNDGIASDRPSGVPRNSLTLPARYNVDVRLSRQVPIGPTKAEVIAELKNIFNTVQWSGVNATIATNAQGVPLSGSLPENGDQLPPTGGYEQRQFQLGFRFIF